MICQRSDRPGTSRETSVRAFVALALLVVFSPLQARSEAPSEPANRPASTHGDRPTTRRPNLLLLVADDHRGGTLGIDGDPRRATPNLDALARQGTRFTRAFCNAPVCTASRQSFITGRLPHAVGVTRLPTPLPNNAVTLGDWLGTHGYETAAIGKMHFNGPSHHGFTERIDLGDYRAWLRANPPRGGDHRRPWRPFESPASEWLNGDCRSHGLPIESMDSTFFADQAIDYLSRHRDRPFALVVSFYDPHSPFRFPREWQGRYRPRSFPVPEVSVTDRRETPRVFQGLTPPQIQEIQAAYFTSLSYLDHEVGRVLDALDRSGLGGETLVVYLGDNGYMLGEHGRFEKHCFYEPAVRVPLLLRWAGRLPAGRRVDGLVELVDLVPTIADLLGVDAPTDLHGRSLVPMLRDPNAPGRETVFSEYLENEEAMIRSDRYKLVVGTGRRKRLDGYETGRPLPGPYERLYDLQSDPGETTDLSSRPDHAEVKASLIQKLHLRLLATPAPGRLLPAGLSPLETIHHGLVPPDPEPRR